MSKFITGFMHDETGATAVEYGLIVALIAVVIITAVTEVMGSATSARSSTRFPRASPAPVRNRQTTSEYVEGPRGNPRPFFFALHRRR